MNNTKNTLAICGSLMLSLTVANAAPVLNTGTPANSLLNTPTAASPSLGVLYNFDGLTPTTTFNPTTYAASGLTISSPDGLLVEPFSTQTFPNELFDNSSNGTANITITLSKGTNKIGVGIADSDAVMVMLQALNMSGVGFGSIFSVNVNAGSTANPGNGYYVLADTTPDIFGLKILQTSGSSNFSGLAIDDVQTTTPEPGSLFLLLIGISFLGWLRFRKTSSIN